MIRDDNGRVFIKRGIDHLPVRASRTQTGEWTLTPLETVYIIYMSKEIVESEIKHFFLSLTGRVDTNYYL